MYSLRSIEDEFSQRELEDDAFNQRTTRASGLLPAGRHSAGSQQHIPHARTWCTHASV